MKKLIALLLTLILICSMIPMAAAADENRYFFRDEAGTWYESLNGADGPYDTKVTDKDLLADLEKDYLDFIASNPTATTIVHGPMDHELGWNCNTKYHWKECACGARFGEELHVDPLDTDDDYCICGYHFSDNADLVTLWLKGCPPIKYFNKNKTEYKLNAYTYKDFKETKISTKTFDSEATVELPEDLTLKEGENKFEIKVTAENKKVTKVYTVIITK